MQLVINLPSRRLHLRVEMEQDGARKSQKYDLEKALRREKNLQQANRQKENDFQRFIYS